ncbi:C45 family autoproteolytic acyltransferase/hydolase [Geosporobacter ferrireducens]|uniref:C45 family autoproteolytic acyltransferase/hydolase n=1 Tax=Geosporobacter ferrireducens TaxID=1424294 RepID=UPI00139CCB00|nr:C45 family peptidase [Geosporobacter ferrireducens]MTI55709.1 linear amide C-N hydrolase [Geosporobacter ferrireducens]
MKKTITQFLALKGNHYDIGWQMGKQLSGNIGICGEAEALSKDLLEEALKLYDQFCPGLTDELRGYADAKGVALNRLIFTSMTYLRPNCSEMVLLPEKTQNDHVLLARSYEFAPQYEDFRLYRVVPTGKYAYIGGSVAEFGRSEGLNEHGLGISMTSCGFPVSNMETMRKPAFKGLQFWAVVRTLLENCKTVEEALSRVKEMPVPYNINLLMADASGSAVLYETLDGNAVYGEISSEDAIGTKYLHATNHSHFEPMMTMEPFAMKNSIVRYEKIDAFLSRSEKKSIEDLKSFLLMPYPDGMNCHYFSAFFGTIKSVVMDLNDLSFYICWGGYEQNGWERYSIKNDLPEVYEICTSREIEFEDRAPAEDFFAQVPLK